MRAQDQEPADTSRSRPRRTHTPAAGPAPAPVDPAMPLTPQAILRLQRSAGNTAVARLVEVQRREDDDQPVQRSAVPEVLSSPGRPLDDDTRTEMEARLGADFSDVRMHTDATAQRSAAEIGASAYTSGHHIVAGTGGVDKHTLAHELTHVLQQRSGPVAGTDNGAGLSISDPADRFEREAEANARQVMSGGAQPEAHADSGRSTIARIQRTPAEPKTKATKKRGRRKKTLDSLANALSKLKIKTPGERVAEVMRKELAKHGWRAHGGIRNLTMHYTANVTDPAEEAKKENLVPPAAANIYGDTANAVQWKSFAGKRDEQAIRWISTLALNYLNDRKKHPEEVQATLQNKVLYIASNKNGANKVLRELADEKKTGTEFLKALIEANNSGSLDERQERHKNKARSRLTKGTELKDYADILAALTSKPVVPKSTKPDGLHAERRLAAEVGREVVRTGGPTAGTKRPCVACYFDLYQDMADKPHPGPYWPSKAANIGFGDYSSKGAKDLAKQIHDAIVKKGGTFASIHLQCAEEREARVESVAGGVEIAEAGGDVEEEAGGVVKDDGGDVIMEEGGDVVMAEAGGTSAAGAAAGGRKRRARKNGKNRVDWDVNTSSDSSASDQESEQR